MRLLSDHTIPDFAASPPDAIVTMSQAPFAILGGNVPILHQSLVWHLRTRYRKAYPCTGVRVRMQHGLSNNSRTRRRLGAKWSARPNEWSWAIEEYTMTESKYPCSFRHDVIRFVNVGSLRIVTTYWIMMLTTWQGRYKLTGSVALLSLCASFRLVLSGDFPTACACHQSCPSTWNIQPPCLEVSASFISLANNVTIRCGGSEEVQQNNKAALHLTIMYVHRSFPNYNHSPNPSILNRLIVSTNVLLLSTLLAKSTPSLVIICVAPTVLRL